MKMLKMANIADAIVQELKRQRGVQRTTDTVFAVYTGTRAPLNVNEIRYRMEDGTIMVFTPDLRIYGLGPSGHNWEREMTRNEIAELSNQTGSVLGLNMGSSPTNWAITCDYHPRTILKEETTMTIYCVTVDPTNYSDEVWSQFEEESKKISNVDGDEWDLGTTWEVWAATTDKQDAYNFMSRVESVLGQQYVMIEEK